MTRRDEEHVCERERWLDYQLFVQREDIERLEDDIAAWLNSPEGHFEAWDAERKSERAPVRRGAARTAPASRVPARR